MGFYSLCTKIPMYENQRFWFNHNLDIIFNLNSTEIKKSFVPYIV